MRDEVDNHRNQGAEHWYYPHRQVQRKVSMADPQRQSGLGILPTTTPDTRWPMSAVTVTAATYSAKPNSEAIPSLGSPSSRQLRPMMRLPVQSRHGARPHTSHVTSPIRCAAGPIAVTSAGR